MDKHQALYHKVIDFAKNNDDVRAVVMNGSRVNANIKPDDYQDFDIVYYVREFHRFMEDKQFIKTFGDILVIQTKDDQRPDVSEDELMWYIYLIQFKDGTRLDLTILDIDDLEKKVYEDSLTKILLDKDELINDLKEADESSYYVQKPTNKEIFLTVNEFYWVCPYVGKGLARNHVFYAIKHLDILRREIERMIDWWIGHKHDYKISVGKGKHRYVDLLPIGIYNKYTDTYTDTRIDSIWKALYISIDIFDELYQKIAAVYDIEYHQDYRIDIINFIKNNYKKNERV
ncbi:MAG: aminoglycoside 6-adenylyltransferase [Tenericutes bacterium]|jgi:aminoglycoside 6-adenylyltransferase|nr:aminoglycoside 6-adenylyltransferase [Mycoplasmatota bacterium]